MIQLDRYTVPDVAIWAQAGTRGPAEIEGKSHKNIIIVLWIFCTVKVNDQGFQHCFLQLRSKVE